MKECPTFASHGVARVCIHDTAMMKKHKEQNKAKERKKNII